MIRYQFCNHTPSRLTSMAWCKKDVTPLLTHWSYAFLALSHRPALLLYDSYHGTKLLRYLTAISDHLDARATKTQILKISYRLGWLYLIYTTLTGDPLHSRAACTQPCNVNTHSRAHCSPGARLCEQWGHGCVNNGARLCASARLCRGSPVTLELLKSAVRHGLTGVYPQNMLISDTK